MNSGEAILKLQESDSNIRLLAAQRELYARSKAWGRLSLFSGVILPIFMAISESICVWPGWAYFFVPIAALVMDAIAAAFSGNDREEAAEVQQCFESSVYGIDFPYCHLDEEKVQRTSNRYLARHGTDELRGWFPTSIAGEDPVQAVASCQRTCSTWSEKLLIYCVIFSAIPLLACLTLAFCPRDAEPALSASIVMPAAEWSIKALVDWGSSLRNVRRLNQAIRLLGNADEQTIRRVQDSIYSYRLNRPIPETIYLISRKRYEQQL